MKLIATALHQLHVKALCAMVRLRFLSALFVRHYCLNPRIYSILKYNQSVFAIIAVVCVTGSVTAWCTPTVSLVPNGNNRYIVQAGNLKGVVSASFQIEYDPSDGSQPSFVSSVSNAEVTSLPGTISVLIKPAKPLSGNTALGVVSNLTANIFHASALLENQSGGTDSVDIPVPPPQSKASGTSASSDAQRASNQSRGRQSSQGEQQDVTVPAEPGTGSAIVSGNVSIEQRKTDTSEYASRLSSRSFKRIGGLMQRFLSLGELASEPELSQLLKQVENAKFRQVPQLALSDGETVVKVFFDVNNKKELQCVILSSCRFVSLAQASSEGWAVEVMPEKGVLEPTITVMTSDEMTEYPVAVVPPLNSIGKTDTDPSLLRYIRIANNFISHAQNGPANPSSNQPTR